MRFARVTGPSLARMAAAGVLAVAFASALNAQSLGDLARKEEERRKAVKTPGKLYTNESLRPEPGSVPAAAAPSPSGAAVPPSPSGPPPAAAGGPTKPDTPAADTKDEAYWRQRIQASRDALQRAQMFAEALQSRINALSADFASRDDPAQRNVVGNDRQKALAELDRVKQEIEQHTKAIAATQDEARRAGVPPGWLR
jgi:hypothetical protein